MINHLKYIFLFLFVLFGLNLFAQTDTVQYGKLEVKVIDAMTKKPIEDARVKITAKDFNKIAFSDSVGKLVFDSLQFKPYQLDISYFGYYKRNINCFPINSIIPDTLVIKLIVNPDIKIIESRCPPPLIKKDEPTHQNFNNKQIMRMPY